MGLDFFKKNKKDDIQDKLERAGGLETEEGRKISREVDSLESNKLKKSFSSRYFTDEVKARLEKERQEREKSKHDIEIKEKIDIKGTEIEKGKTEIVKEKEDEIYKKDEDDEDIEVINSDFSKFEFVLFLFKQKAKKIQNEEERNRYIESIKNISKLPRKEKREKYIEAIRFAFDSVSVHKRMDLDAKGILFLSKITGLNFDKFNYEKILKDGKDKTEPGSINYIENSTNYLKDGFLNEEIETGNLIADLSGMDGLNVFKTSGPRFSSDYISSTLDHHSQESVKGNSTSKQFFELLKSLGLLNNLDKNDLEYLEGIISFINREDDKIYDISSLNFDYNNSYKTLFGYTKDIFYLESLFKCKSIKNKFLNNNPRTPLEFIELTEEEFKFIGVNKNKIDYKKSFLLSMSSSFEKNEELSTIKLNNNKKIFLTTEDHKKLGFKDKNLSNLLICNNYSCGINYFNNGLDFSVLFFEGSNFSFLGKELIEELKDSGCILARGVIKKIDKKKIVKKDLFEKVLNKIKEVLELQLETEIEKNIISDLDESKHLEVSNSDVISEDNNDYNLKVSKYWDESIDEETGENTWKFIEDKNIVLQYGDAYMNVIKESFGNDIYPDFITRLNSISNNPELMVKNLRTFSLLSESKSFHPKTFIKINNKTFYFTNILREEGKNDIILFYVDDGINLYSRVLSASEIGNHTMVDVPMDEIETNFRTYSFIQLKKEIFISHDENGNIKEKEIKSHYIGNESIIEDKESCTVELDNDGDYASTKIHPVILDHIKKLKVENTDTQSIYNNFSILTEEGKINPYAILSHTTNEILKHKIQSLKNFYIDNDYIEQSFREKIEELTKNGFIGFIENFENFAKNAFSLYGIDKLKSSPNIKIDFESTSSSYNLKDYNFGEIICNVFSGKIEDRDAEFVLMTNSEGNVWVDEIRYKNSDVSSYGTNIEIIDSGILTHPPFGRKRDNIMLHAIGSIWRKINEISESENIFYKNKIKDFKKIEEVFKNFVSDFLGKIKYKEDSEYIDISWFLQDLDIIKQYKNSKVYRDLMIKFNSSKKQEDVNQSRIQIEKLTSLLDSF